MSRTKSTRSISDEIKLLIIKNYNEGKTITELVKCFKISRSSVNRIISNVESTKRGRKLSYNAKNIQFQLKRATKCLLKDGQKVTARKLLPKISEKVTLRTLQRCLYANEELVYRNIPKQIILNPEKRSKRVEIIKEWFINNVNFKNVIFTDECRLSLDGPHKFMSWQLHSKDNDWERPLRANNGSSIMIYGTIGYDGKLIIRKLDDYLNGERYLALLQRDVIPLLKTRFSSNFILQQDNARPHIYHGVKNFFDSEQLNVLKWPPYSPDMSLIENVWKILKDLVYTTPTFETKDQLWLKIRMSVNEFNMTKSSTIKSMYDGLSNKYLNIIAKNGSNKK